MKYMHTSNISEKSRRGKSISRSSYRINYTIKLKQGFRITNGLIKELHDLSYKTCVIHSFYSTMNRYVFGQRIDRGMFFIDDTIYI